MENQNHPYVDYQIGLAYDLGEGVTPDYAKAYEFYRIS